MQSSAGPAKPTGAKPTGAEPTETQAEKLSAEIYAKLRQMAEQIMHGEGPGHTLQPTALVHEAFLKVAAGPGAEASSTTHVRALFAQAMRRILVDHARKKRARKRGGERVRVAIDEQLLSAESEEDVLDLNDVLERLEKLDAAQAQLVELRIFGGMNVAEAAEEMGLSKRTAEREWTAARAWLRQELATVEPHDS
jgi:RNA polymerase sigma-70 factor (ECF subfamily)